VTAAYVDSSVLLAIVFGEPGGTAMARRCGRLEALYTANLTEAEVLAALAREGIERPPSGLFASVAWVLPSRPLGAEIVRALGAGRLRGADLWHVACALYLEPEPDELVFLTLDANQRSVAARLGFGA
jgi:predicted nucleic acid-binding protein